MICLTFDTDWMTEASLSKFLKEFQFSGRATFFAHKKFDCLESSSHEVGPHPFINNLEDWQQGLKILTDQLVKPVCGVRAHSCVFSHMIGVGLFELGFEYVSQANNLYQEGLYPFRHPWGIWELPIYYMDNMDFWMAKNWKGFAHFPFSRDLIKQAITGNDLYVFDFHPLHIALNSRSSDDYQSVKSRIIEEGICPFDLAFPGAGTRTFFEDLCQEMHQAQVVSLSCSQALNQWRSM